MILTGIEGQSFEGETLELLDTNGTTVLATGTATPLSGGVNPTNADLAILDFLVPADGIYTFRVSASFSDVAYSLVVAYDVTIDAEPNNNRLTDPLRSISANQDVIGYLAAGSDDDDFYTIDLNTGDQFSAETVFPLLPQSSPINTLDAELEVFLPSGTSHISDTNSATDGINAALSFTAPETGQYVIRVGATSGVGEYLLATQIVPNVNEAPTITSDGGGATAAVNAAENQTAVTDVQSTDDSDSEGSGLTYTITGGADQGLFSIVAATGVLTFNVAPDFENPTDANTDGDYLVQVTVTDSGSLTDVQDITVTVTNVNEAPVITSDGGGATAAVNAAENQTAVTDVQSTDDSDSEGSGLTYTITGGADQGLFSIVAATGVLTFNVAPDFENPTDANTDGDYLVQVTVTDSGSLTDVQDITVTVTNVNEAPIITSDGGGATAAVNAAENQTAVTDVQATDDSDSEGSGLTYTISGGADQGLFSIVAATGVLTFNVAPDFENPTDANTDGDYLVQVTVTDSGSLTDVQDITVTVANVNEAPIITSDGGGATAAVNAAENQTAVTDVQATDDSDSEGSGLTYTISGGADQGLFSIVAATGVLTFNVAPDFENPTDANTDGDYLVQVTVTDSGSLTDVQDITVTVTNVNEAPIITSDGGGAAAAVNAAENQTAVTDVQATDDSDSEGSGLTYTISGGADQEGCFPSSRPPEY